MKFRPLEKVRTIIQDATGLDIMYAYDDLIFPEYGAYVMQFDESVEKGIFCFLNTDFDYEAGKEEVLKLENAFRKEGFKFSLAGKFKMVQADQEVKIEFLTEEIIR